MTKVLNDGFVHYVDHMGSDDAIVQAARVSYGKGTKSVSDDRTLIRYLMRHLHFSCFEMCELKLHVRVPMDTWRQWIRHRSACVNEYSTRYSEAIDSMYQASDWRLQSPSNKQGSSGIVEDRSLFLELQNSEDSFQNLARGLYADRLKAGVARELARKDLPLSTYTEAYWKIDLRNLFNFLKLRLDEHAQWEIRQYAQAIAEITKEKFPIAYEAFEDYILNAITFSKQELKFFQGLYLKPVKNPKRLSNKRELLEFDAKIQRILDL